MSYNRNVQAVEEAFDILSTFMNVAGGLSLSSVVEMLVSLVLTVRVVTVPIIMRSVHSHHFALLLLAFALMLCSLVHSGRQSGLVEAVRLGVLWNDMVVVR